MLKFSIRNLLLSFTFLALVCAWFVAKDSDQAHRRIASIAVRPDGKTAVVCMLLSYQWPRKHAQKFERSIFEVDVDRMKTGRLIRQDTLARNNDVYEPFFWNSQARVVVAGSYVLFLDRTRQKLLAKDTASWSTKEIAEFPLGEIKSFDSSTDGTMVVFEAITDYREELDELAQVEKYIKQQQGEADEFRSRISAGFVTTLGVNEPASIVVEPTKYSASLEEAAAAESFVDLDSVHAIPPGAPEGKKRNHFNWRTAIVPTKNPDELSENRIAILGGAVSKELKVDEIEKVGGELYNAVGEFRHRLKLRDVDASMGKVRFAKLLNQEFVINVETDEIPERDDVDISVPLEASTNSSIRLSKDGKWAAISRVGSIRDGLGYDSSNEICLFDTNSIFKGYSAGMLDQLAATGSIVSAVEPTKRLQFENEVTSFEFVDGTDLMLVGDSAGKLILVNTNTNKELSSLNIPGQPKKLTRKLVTRLAFLWLLAFLGLMIFTHYRKTKIGEETQMSDSIPMA